MHRQSQPRATTTLPAALTTLMAPECAETAGDYLAQFLQTQASVFAHLQPIQARTAYANILRTMMHSANITSEALSACIERERQEDAQSAPMTPPNFQRTAQEIVKIATSNASHSSLTKDELYRLHSALAGLLFPHNSPDALTAEHVLSIGFGETSPPALSQQDTQGNQLIKLLDALAGKAFGAKTMAMGHR